MLNSSGNEVVWYNLKSTGNNDNKKTMLLAVKIHLIKTHDNEGTGTREQVSKREF